MSFDAIKDEIAKWDDASLRKLIAYAVVLQDKRSGRLEEISKKLDDPDPSRWITLEELDRRLGFDERDLNP